MKAAILSINPDTQIVDVTHRVTKFNIRMGAFVLATVSQYFPKGTIHVGVVDPGVGTKRRSILIQTKDSYFIGPDNGLLVLAAESQNITYIREISNPQFMLPKVSCTFHGRDIFAPAAAHLADDVDPAEFGPETHNIERPDFAKVTLDKNAVVGEVLHVDNFGNIITNISKEKATRATTAGLVNIELAKEKLKLRVAKTYGEARSLEAIALIGSHGYLEIALNQGSAAEKFNANPGDRVRISFV